MQSETQSPNINKWRGTLEWVICNNKYKVQAQLTAVNPVPHQYIRYFKELWPEKIELQLAQPPIQKLFPHYEIYFTADVLAQPSSDFNILKHVLSSKKIAVALFKDSGSFAGWGVVLALSKENILKGIIFVWDLKSHSHSQQFAKCLTALGKEIFIDRTKLQSSVGPKSQQILQETDKDMAVPKPLLSGSRNGHSKTKFTEPHQGKGNSSCSNYKRKRKNGTIPNQCLNKITLQQPQKLLGAHNPVLQNSNFSGRDPVIQSQKFSRWSASPGRSHYEERNYSHTQVKHFHSQVKQSRSPNRSRSRSPMNPFWRSARQDRPREFLNGKHTRSPAHASVQKPTTQPRNENYQPSTSTYSNAQRPSTKPSNAVGQSSSTSSSVNTKTQHSANVERKCVVNNIKGRTENVANNTLEHNSFPTTQKISSTINLCKTDENKTFGVKSVEVPYNMTSHESIRQILSCLEQPSTSQDKSHSDQDHDIMSAESSVIKIESVYFDHEPLASEGVVYRQQSQSPDSNVHHSDNTLNDKEEEDIAMVSVAEYLAPLHNILKCFKCKRWVSKDQVRICICALSCVECARASPNCPDCHAELAPDERLSWLYHRISSVIPHPCPHEGCIITVNPGETDHEATCTHRPLVCPICALNISKSLVFEHFKDNHSQYIPLEEGENTNIPLSRFLSDTETNTIAIYCFLQEQFLKITLHKCEDEQKDAQFMIEKQIDSSSNFTVKMVFKKGSWSCTFVNSSRRASCLLFVEVPRDVVEEWSFGRCTLDIFVNLKQKRKINRNSNSAKKSKVVQDKSH